MAASMDFSMKHMEGEAELLAKFCLNNIRVGQWELARACIHTILRKDWTGVIDELTKILREISSGSQFYR